VSPRSTEDGVYSTDTEGTSEEIARHVLEINGHVVRAIVFIEESPDTMPVEPLGDLFAEMSPFTVTVGDADDSREAVYSEQAGE
jgi:hypothetical protein